MIMVLVTKMIMFMMISVEMGTDMVWIGIPTHGMQLPGVHHYCVFRLPFQTRSPVLAGDVFVMVA